MKCVKGKWTTTALRAYSDWPLIVPAMDERVFRVWGWSIQGLIGLTRLELESLIAFNTQYAPVYQLVEHKLMLA